MSSALLLLNALLGCTAPPFLSEPPAAPDHDPSVRHWAHAWAGGQGPLFDEVLALAGMTHRDFRFDPLVLAAWGGDRYRTPLFDLLHRDPWNASTYGREHAANARRSAPKVHDLLFLAEDSIGVRCRDNFYAGFLGESAKVVESDGPLALARALLALDPALDRGAIAAKLDAAAVPAEVSASAALLLRAIADAEGFRRLALLEPLARAGIEPEWAAARAYDECFWREADDDDANLGGEAKFAEARRMLATERMLDAVDFPLLARGANLVALATDEAVRRLAQTDPAARFDLSIETRLGLVRLCGAGAHEHGRDGRHLLLAIDTAGDDRWYAGGASGEPRLHAIGVAIDLSGDDRYETVSFGPWHARNEEGPRGKEEGFRQERPDEHAPAFGAGRMGYGILVDAAGDDLYHAPIAAFGCGLLGHGALLDLGGDDHYQSDTGAQGSGTFGTGTLADLGGDDEYRGYHRSMGFGGTKGAGVLVDLGGDDAYLAETDRVKYSWFDDFGTQLNMTQGFAYGRRADMDDGHSWAGGMGMLVDGGGGDYLYRCGIYGIGCAYWYALGLLHDDGGDDRYESDSYSIASPPHFAVGIVIDEAGDDIWRSRGSRGCGFGRDFALGWFEECGGNDIYLCSDSAFGVGNNNGLGVCWDKGGDDLWCAKSNSFGQPYVESGGTRRDFPVNCGLFLDGGGRDRYIRLPPDADTWRLDARSTGDDRWPFIGDGIGHSWRRHIAQPGSTGGALDREAPAPQAVPASGRSNFLENRRNSGQAR